MTSFRSDTGAGKTLGLFGAIAVIAVGLAYLWSISTDDRPTQKTSDLVHAFDIVWEMQNTRWREAEGLYALETELVPVRGSGRFKDSVEAISNTFCGAILSSLPRDAPISRRSQLFRVKVTLPTLGTEAARPQFYASPRDGACHPIARGNTTFGTYPGLAPDWYLSEWKAKSQDLAEFKVIFRRTAAQPLSSLDLDRTCRAALFDLPDTLGEHSGAFARLRTMRIAAEAGFGGSLFKVARSLAWDVDIGPAGCGTAREVAL